MCVCVYALLGRKKKVKNWEEDDFYSSDEDTFLDRTGMSTFNTHTRTYARTHTNTHTQTTYICIQVEHFTYILLDVIRSWYVTVSGLNEC